MRFNYLLLVIFFLAVISCNKDHNDEILYFNSFETSTDTSGWKGFCPAVFVDDTPDNGGEKSMKLSCGCIAPHAYFDIPSCDKDCYLIVTCQGKGAGVGGSVTLKNETGNISLGIDGDIHNWQSFQTTDTLFSSAGEKLTMYLSAGGIASGTIFLDMLQVEKVEK